MRCGLLKARNIWKSISWCRFQRHDFHISASGNDNHPASCIVFGISFKTFPPIGLAFQFQFSVMKKACTAAFAIFPRSSAAFSWPPLTFFSRKGIGDNLFYELSPFFVPFPFSYHLPLFRSWLWNPIFMVRIVFRPVFDVRCEKEGKRKWHGKVEK